MEQVPRRLRLDLNEPAELAIHNAIEGVEEMGADVRLTEAITLLSKAKDLVADFIDGQKLDAANSVVANSILNGWTIDAKIKYVRHILPVHYEVKESKEKGNVHCKSAIGIDDDEQWSYFIKALKQRFADFSEVFHNTCSEHVDFTIYFKKNES